ncbi:MAG: hypothetical protein HETSPECPRED_004243 [Heterodermia speciosa]|uniref:ubiquitinyl hydrolase 1 n=1 Tax=Heterodermia speciosa TaxID=116794 RepID=A0A8H3F7Z3_9LECA|nr:MAG: hypothetical protein HETSPECPRED_004243 [Heterodermia speciosa]
MLREFGVEGVKVQEIVSLDEELLTCLPRPIYGLVFLFKWREEDPDKLEQSCPEEVWFANQTVSNACASVAMLNIVNNIPTIELGEHLQQFKEFTKELSPALRGDAISNFTFVKEVHNSFARKMDMLNADLHMKTEVTARKQSKRPKSGNDDEDTGFHFIAYVPIDDNVWKLDGLKRQPQKLGTAKSADWVRKAKPDIEACMSEYEEGHIEFAILSLVRDPLLDLLPALAINVRGIQALAAHLRGITAEKDEGRSTEHQEWPPDDGTLIGPDLTIGLTQDAIEQAQAPPSIESALGSHVISTILLCQQELCVAQTKLRSLIRDECEAKHSDEEKANARRHDYGPLALKLAQILARKPIVGYEKSGSRSKKQKK